MAKKSLIPEAKEALKKFKVETAAELGIKLKHSYSKNFNSLNTLINSSEK